MSILSTVLLVRYGTTSTVRYQQFGCAGMGLRQHVNKSALVLCCNKPALVLSCTGKLVIGPNSDRFMSHLAECHFSCPESGISIAG